MSAKVTIPIGKSVLQMPHGDCCQVSGGYHRRVGRGEHLCMGWSVVQIVNHPERFELRWCCRICGRRCSLDTLWLAFPQGTAVEGQWVHRGG